MDGIGKKGNPPSQSTQKGSFVEKESVGKVGKSSMVQNGGLKTGVPSFISPGKLSTLSKRLYPNPSNVGIRVGTDISGMDNRGSIPTLGSGVLHCNQIGSGALPKSTVMREDVISSSKNDYMNGGRTPISPHSAPAQSNESANHEFIEPDDTLSIDLSKLQRKRGPTKNLAHLKKKQSKQDVSILVSDPTGRLVGEGAQLFISEASSVVRCHGKWNAEKWGHVDKTEKDKMLKMIEKGFTYTNNKYVKSKLEKQVKRQYRSRRHAHHKHFQQFSSKEEALVNRPKTVKDEEDWAFLCDYFSSDKFKELSERMKECRAAQKTSHTGGTKSFARHRFEKEEKENRKVGSIELYGDMHFSSKKNAMISDYAANKHAQMKDLQIQFEANGTDKAEEEIVIEVDGHLPGECRNKVRGTNLSSKYHAEMEEAKRRANEVETKAANLQSQVLDQEKRIQQLTETQAETNQLLKALMGKLEGKQP